MVRGLSDKEQAALMMLVFVLPPIITWCGLGMPTDRGSLGLLLSSILSGILVFVKEILGGLPPPEETPSNPDEEEKGSGIASRVGKLEVAMAGVQKDISWIKVLVAPTFLISLVSLLILIATSMPR